MYLTSIITSKLYVKSAVLYVKILDTLYKQQDTKHTTIVLRIYLPLGKNTRTSDMFLFNCHSQFNSVL